MPKVVTLGEILVEIMARDIGQTFLQPGVFLGPYPSGAPAIFIDQVGRAGCPAGMIGCVGADDFGRINTDRLAADGVDVSGIVRLPGETTGSAFVTYAADGSRDFIFNIRNSASAKLVPEHLTDTALQGCTHLHVMGSSLFTPGVVAAAQQAIRQVKAQGGTVSFDPNIRKEILQSGDMVAVLKDMLRQTDIFLPSGPELTLLVTAQDEAGAIAELQGLGVREIVIKRGDQGATVVVDSERVDVKPHAVTEVDPTGAGDCFGGMYVACRQLGLAPADALRHANAAGALAVTQRGPMEGAATMAEVQQFLQHELSQGG
jgi:tagatose kinase